MISFVTSPIFKVTDPPGFVIKSEAPSSIACIVTEAPSVATLERITTGTSRSKSLLFFKNSMPFIFGISISSKTTSGFVFLSFSIKSRPFSAFPQTVIP